jgi:hypothetical protein
MDQSLITSALQVSSTTTVPLPLPSPSPILLSSASFPPFRELTWITEAARSYSTEQFLNCYDNATATSHNPRGYTLGIIGLGKIGYLVAKKALFGVWHEDYILRRNTEV